MLKLVSKDKLPTYDKVWELNDEGQENWPVFSLRKLNGEEVDKIDDQLTRTGGGKSTKMYYLGGTARTMKINAALVDWKNVFNEEGQPLPCTDENKGKLPADIRAWLEDDIDEVNRLKGIPEGERKNS